MAEKDYKVNLDPGKVVYASIRRYSDGYSFATMALKMGDNEYMHINYEWEGNEIPEFALDVMEMLKKFNKAEASNVDYSTFERASKVLLDNADELKTKVKE